MWKVSHGLRYSEESRVVFCQTNLFRYLCKWLSKNWAPKQGEFEEVHLSLSDSPLSIY